MFELGGTAGDFDFEESELVTSALMNAMSCSMFAA